MGQIVNRTPSPGTGVDDTPFYFGTQRHLRKHKDLKGSTEHHRHARKPSERPGTPGTQSPKELEQREKRDRAIGQQGPQPSMASGPAMADTPEGQTMSGEDLADLIQEDSPPPGSGSYRTLPDGTEVAITNMGDDKFLVQPTADPGAGLEPDKAQEARDMAAQGPTGNPEDPLYQQLGGVTSNQVDDVADGMLGDGQDVLDRYDSEAVDTKKGIVEALDEDDGLFEQIHDKTRDLLDAAGYEFDEEQTDDGLSEGDEVHSDLQMAVGGKLAEMLLEERSGGMDEETVDDDADKPDYMREVNPRGSRDYEEEEQRYQDAARADEENRMSKSQDTLSHMFPSLGRGGIGKQTPIETEEGELELHDTPNSPHKEHGPGGQGGPPADAAETEGKVTGNQKLWRDFFTTGEGDWSDAFSAFLDTDGRGMEGEELNQWMTHFRDLGHQAGQGSQDGDDGEPDAEGNPTDEEEAADEKFAEQEFDDTSQEVDTEGWSDADWDAYAEATGDTSRDDDADAEEAEKTPPETTPPQQWGEQTPIKEDKPDMTNHGPGTVF